MPLIKNFEVIPDDGGGLRITRSNGTVLQATKGSLAISGTPAQADSIINTFLAGQFANDSFTVQVHVLSTSPLSLQMIASNNDAPIPANWWQTKA